MSWTPRPPVHDDPDDAWDELRRRHGREASRWVADADVAYAGWPHEVWTAAEWSELLAALWPGRRVTAEDRDLHAPPTPQQREMGELIVLTERETGPYRRSPGGVGLDLRQAASVGRYDLEAGRWLPSDLPPPARSARAGDVQRIPSRPEPEVNLK